MADAPTLFVWRGRLTVYDRLNPPVIEHQQGPALEFEMLKDSVYRDYQNVCPFCGSTYETSSTGVAWNRSYDARCASCGFWHASSDGIGTQDQWENAHVGALKQLDINNADLGLDELGSHLRRRFGDIYELSPPMFERLVEDVFQNLGYRTRRTQTTRDGGYDIVLLESHDNNQIIVECKRYSNSRTVGVGVVRHLLGVMLIENLRTAKLVSSSTYTRPAKDAAAIVNASGFSLELIDGDAFLKELDVYNRALPPLSLEDIRSFWARSPKGCR